MIFKKSKINFKNKVAAITGAGSGIGRQLAIQLADLGCHLSLSDINSEGLSGTLRLVDRQDLKITTEILDVSDNDAVIAWANKTVAEHGRVNMIFNNAGVALFDTVELGKRKDLEWIMNINFWGVINGTTAFLPHLRAAGEGHVINISSLYGLIGQPGRSAYNASKFAVRGFTEALRQELELDSENPGISSSCVHPGGISTNIANTGRYGNAVADEKVLRNQTNELLSTTTPRKAASIILKGVQQNKRRIIVGVDARIIDTIQRIMPSAYQWLSVKATQKLLSKNGTEILITPKKDAKVLELRKSS